MNRVMKIFFGVLYILCVSCLPQQAAAKEHNPFVIPEKLDLPAGEIYVSYLAALDNAREHHKSEIIVFFCQDLLADGQEQQTDLWNDFFEENSRIPPSLLNEMNIVILKPGIISSKIFYPKLDPMIFHISDFSERFPSVDLSQSSVIFISVDCNGNDKVQQVRVVQTAPVS